MSSLIEWPSIYGSAYFLPAIVVVVLLLALLLLISSRRRSKAQAARNAEEPLVEIEAPEAEAAEGVGAEAVAVPEEPAVTATQSSVEAAVVESVTAPEPVRVAATAGPSVGPAPVTVTPTAIAVATAAPVAEMAAAPVPVAQVAPVVATAAEAAPEVVTDDDTAPVLVASDFRRVSKGRNARITVKTKGPVSGFGGNDPLSAAVLDILGGWGDLTPEDTKRLELFRPDRVAAAVAVVQLPKSKSNDAKIRLNQLRQYAADLERRSSPTQTAVAVQATTVSTKPLSAPVPQSVPATMSAAAAPLVPPPTGDPFKPQKPAPGSETATAPAMASAAAGLAAAIALGSATKTESQPEPMAVSTGAAAVAASHSEFDDLASFWAEPRPIWKTDKLAEDDPKNVSFEELPAPSYEEIEVRHEVRPPLTAAAATVSAGSSAVPAIAPTIEAASVGATAALVASPPDRFPPDDVESFFWNAPSADPMSRLSVKVETAEQLLALPPDERADMTAFLEPPELAAAFRATNDPELKKAVIDTLEHIGSPASLNALGNCFEDGDCDIQLYALAAADRLLGVA
jgi:hypothetical protein